MAADYISQYIEKQGAYTFYPIAEDHRQYFFQSLGDGIALTIESVVDDVWFVWETLKEVVEGLRLYLVEGRRFRQCYFNVDDGEGLIASGFLGKERE